ncbi:alpha/beta hydrolase [Consotaella aegiceratis]|uniref:alpha/beta hydrolase n=1 Tax=Consotaella aegiceratis TaxID=3097961 RepID=UPI002F3ED984
MKLRLGLGLLVLLVVAGLGIWLFGPREPVDLRVTFDPDSIGDDPAAYLAREEADIPNLRGNAAKEIVWAYPNSRAKTPLAIVYVHGFSADKAEVRPLPDRLAQALHANLFLTRLTGHGRDGVAMEMASVNDWMNDLAEAIQIGRRIGERVVIVANSTGATLATLGATRPGLMKGVDGLVLMSPNYELRDWRASLLTYPFARDLALLIGGPETGFEPVNAAMAKHWTTHYPTAALLPMAALMKAAREADLGSIRIPTLFVVSPNDQVIDPATVRAAALRWGAPTDMTEVTDSGDPAGHVLAGDILSPGTTDEVARRIAEWVRALPRP